jgi:hypothetical protein
MERSHSQQILPLTTITKVPATVFIQRTILPGRDNNHGCEGLTVIEDGNTLYAFMQTALNQEGGESKPTDRYTQLVKNDISVPTAPRYAREFVVPLPLYNDPTANVSKNPKVAAKSEIFHIQDG